MSLLLLPILGPALLALWVVLARPGANLREGLAVAMGLANAGLWLSWWSGALPPPLLLAEPIPGLLLRLELEPLGLLFGTVTAVLWPITTIYAAGYMRANAEKYQNGFFAAFAASIAGAQLIALAGDLLTLFVGYEWLTLATWPLVTHKRNADAKRGGRIYLGVLLTTSLGLLLPAIVATVLITGESAFKAGGLLSGTGLSATALGLLFAAYMFGIGKAALMPGHRWLPAAMVAPTPVSALLHAVAVVKAGVFCVLKITVYVFGIDLLATSGTAAPILWVAAFSLLAASVVALYSDNLKRRLAYSTVSQLAYVVVGATLATGLGIVGGGMHIVMHAFGKITLFFVAGAIYTAAHKQLVSELDGLGRTMPWTFAAFTLGALSIIGLPPLGGAWSKWFLMSGAASTEQMLLLAVLTISSLLNIVYLLEIPLRGFFGPRPADHAGCVQEAPLACLLPLLFTAMACVALFVFPQPLLALLSVWSPT